MKYWDASAVIPLIHEEWTSDSIQAIFGQDADHVTLSTTRVEVECTLARLMHEGKISHAQAGQLRGEAKRLFDAFALVAPGDSVVRAAVRLARAHPIGLRAGDALHLAAWDVASDSNPGAVEFVTFDKRLREAALAEGATVVP